MTLILTRYKLEKATNRFEKLPNSKIVDETIKYAIERFPTNDNLIGVYTKTVLINTLYKTSIIGIITLAEHIFNKGEEIDTKLKEGDIAAIDDIRLGHKIRSTRGRKKEIDFYSFATKYAHFHEPHSFPIYDNRVMRLLTKANKTMKFHKKFSQNELKKYKKYKLVVDSLAHHLNITNWGYKKIDQGLWQLAKEVIKREKEGKTRDGLRQLRNEKSRN